MRIRNGSILVLLTEGGEEASGTNINYLLEEFGISINADAVVGTVPIGKYTHPKEALITGAGTLGLKTCRGIQL